jgi:hypothetical protein
MQICFSVDCPTILIAQLIPLAAGVGHFPLTLQIDLRVVSFWM